MAQQQDLQDHLKTLSDTVYFQPPSMDKMIFPCIVYNIDDEFVNFADNNPYNRVLGYEITVMDRRPDSDIREKVAQMPMTKMTRTFRANGLNHFVFKTFF